MPDSLRIAICTTQVPFVYGGNEVLVEGLRDALSVRGHRVAVVALPYKWHPRTEIVTSALAWRMIDLTEANGEAIDIVICTKWPSYVVKHPRKVTWLVHQFRQAYDWFGTPLSDFTGFPLDVRVRHIVSKMDRNSLSESHKIFTISENVANRLLRFNGLRRNAPVPSRALRAGPYARSLWRLCALTQPPRRRQACRPSVGCVSPCARCKSCYRRDGAGQRWAQTQGVKAGVSQGAQSSSGSSPIVRLPLYTATRSPSIMRPWTKITAMARLKRYRPHVL